MKISNYSVDCLKYLKEILVTRAITRGNFTLASGKTSSFYIDCRLVSMSNDGMDVIGDSILEFSYELSPTVICGPESAGIPLVCATVSAYDNDEIHGCFVRKETKQYGIKNLIEGKQLTEADRVLMVEDVTTSGESLVKATLAVQSTHAIVVGAICIIDRLQGAKEKLLNECGVNLTSLFTISDFGLTNE